MVSVGLGSELTIKGSDVTIVAFEITVSLLKEACGERAFERGNNYFRQGRVLQLQEQIVSEAHTVITATNRGSGGRFYEQEVNIYQFHNELFLEGHCSCPVGYNCKHVVAACLSAMGTRTTSRKAIVRDDFSRWLARLAFAKGSQGSQELEKSADYLIYGLTPEIHGESVEVAFSIARVKRDGRFGKERRASLPSFPGYYAVPAYMRREDEEIVTLLRASSLNIRGGVSLNGAAGSLALKLMLETGRAFWGDQREAPLRLASPREMGLAWKEESKRFHLRLETSDGLHLVPVEPPLFIDARRQEAGELILPAGIDSEWVRHLVTAPTIPVSEAERTSRWLAINHPQLPTPLPIEVSDIGQPIPTPRLTLGQANISPLEIPLALDFLYQGIAVDGARVERVLTICAASPAV
jgi:hypothetical protein